MSRIFSYPVTGPEAGKTVQELLLSRGYSRRLIIDLKKSPGLLTIDGAQVFVTRQLCEGETLIVRMPPEVSSPGIVPTPMKLDLLYEDEDLIVLNKQADLPIHPSQGNYDNTLANGMAWYFARKKEPFVYRVINRLDRDTTGLLILAKNALSSCILSDMVKNRQIHRTYLAVADGDIRQIFPEGAGIIDAPIARTTGSVIERQVDFVRGEPARTRVRLLDFLPEYQASLLELQLETGRTHQIRVHLKYLGHPLFGDFLYNPDYRYFSRQSLHSWKLSFSHPVSGKTMDFTAPVPDDMTAFAGSLFKR